MSFWKNKKVFITGHTGFKGAWLSAWLDMLGAEVTGYALRPPTDLSLFEILRLRERMKTFEGDIRDLEGLRRAMMESQPEIVIHMAAQSLVRKSFRSPAETFEVNVMGTVNVFESVRTLPGIGVRAILNVTSDKCYANTTGTVAGGQPSGHTEDAPLGGLDPYSSSKGCSELVTAAYRESFLKNSIAVATARAGNVIGGGDWAEDRLVPDIFRALAKSEVPEIRNPNAVRPWQFVLDALAGYLKLSEKLCTESAGFDEAWNFGPLLDQCKPVSYLVGRLSGKGELSDDKSFVGEARDLFLNSDKANKYLQWETKLDLDQTLDWTKEWYEEFVRQTDMIEFSKNQIREYQSLLSQKL